MFHHEAVHPSTECWRGPNPLLNKLILRNEWKCLPHRPNRSHSEQHDQQATVCLTIILLQRCESKERWAVYGRTSLAKNPPAILAINRLPRFLLYISNLASWQLHPQCFLVIYSCLTMTSTNQQFVNLMLIADSLMLLNLPAGYMSMGSLAKCHFKKGHQKWVGQTFIIFWNRKSDNHAKSLAQWKKQDQNISFKFSFSLFQSLCCNRVQCCGRLRGEAVLKGTPSVRIITSRLQDSRQRIHHSRLSILPLGQVNTYAVRRGLTTHLTV